MTTFLLGDVVELRCGGRLMVVAGGERGDAVNEIVGEDIICAWHDADGHPQRWSYPRDTLMKCKPMSGMELHGRNLVNGYGVPGVAMETWW